MGWLDSNKSSEFFKKKKSLFYGQVKLTDGNLPGYKTEHLKLKCQTRGSMQISGLWYSG